MSGRKGWEGIAIMGTLTVGKPVILCLPHTWAFSDAPQSMAATVIPGHPAYRHKQQWMTMASGVTHHLCPYTKSHPNGNGWCGGLAAKPGPREQCGEKDIYPGLEKGWGAVEPRTEERRGGEYGHMRGHLSFLLRGTATLGQNAGSGHTSLHSTPRARPAGCHKQCG